MRERIMWIIIFGVSILAGVAGAMYLSRKIEKTGIFASTSNAMIRSMFCVLAVVVILFVLGRIFDVTNTIIIVLHLAVFLLIGDLVGFLIRRSAGADIDQRFVDLGAVIICFIYLCVGWYFMHGLWETDYMVATDKDTGRIRIAQIADSHIGCGFDAAGFAERLSKIQETDPDILVIAGDFVDDDTSFEDMKASCEALSKFKTRYGIYYCFGNHDAGYSAGKRGYSGEDVASELTKNGVVVLQDESVLVDGRFYVIGRKDAGYGSSNRLGIDELIGSLDKDKYMIVLDHQPTDYEAEEAAGVDLVLSGHTHGGQIFPLEYVQPLVSENDNVRGHEKRGGTDFVVTDGISDWAIKFKTGCKSEFVIVDVVQERS